MRQASASHSTVKCHLSLSNIPSNHHWLQSTCSLWSVEDNSLTKCINFFL